MSKSKSDKVKVRDVGSGEYFTGRFMGFITEEECKAIINSPDAPKKIWTSESLGFNDVTFDCHKKRFVVVTSDHKGYSGNRVFISPKVTYMAYSGKVKKLSCSGRSEFEITMLEE